jgi:competence protein ComGC
VVYVNKSSQLQKENLSEKQYTTLNMILMLLIGMLLLLLLLLISLFGQLEM